VSLDFEKWAAAGKPCLRQSCGHPHADHIPSEAMECDQCDCLRFIGFTQPDDRRCHGAELTACFERDAIPLRAPPYRGAMGMTNNRSDATDLRQDTMLSAYAGFGSFRQGTNLNAWLHRILTNAAAAVLMSGSVGPTGLGVASGIAQAAPVPASLYHWCADDF
jgi:Sigma-70 region 2